MTTTPTLTLTAFLEARIAAEEQAAMAAQSVSRNKWDWHATATMTARPLSRRNQRERVEPVVPTIMLNDGEVTGLKHDQIQFIARFDPARVLAECEAKRAVVALHAGVHECVGVKYGELATVYVSPGFVYELDPTLRILAAVYSDHPDYNPGWA